MSIQKYFPTLIYRANLSSNSALHQRLTKESYVFRDLDNEGRSWSKENYPAGYTSYSSVDDLMVRSPYFDQLRKNIDKHALRYAKALELDMAGRKLRMSSLWVNIMGRLSHHPFHLHPLSVISGTYYLKTPKGCGDFKIEDPRIQSFMASPRKSKTGTDNARYIQISPKAGQLLLFESWLKHEVTANLSGSDRVSVSFNYSLDES